MTDRHPDWVNAEHTTGTTIMAVEFDGGVVIGADSRTTTGSYVANRVTDKLTRITDHIYCCRSGSAAHTQAVADIVQYHTEFLAVQTGEPSEVKQVAHSFRNVCYQNRDGLSAGIICAGWDPVLGGQVYTIPLGGMCLRRPFAMGGSGSTYLYGHCDNVFKPAMTLDQCVDFVTTAVALAMARDGSSGGVVRLGIITSAGIERRVITEPNLPAFYDN